MIGNPAAQEMLAWFLMPGVLFALVVGLASLTTPEGKDDE